MMPTSGAMDGIWLSRSTSLKAAVLASSGKCAFIDSLSQFADFTCPDIAFTQFGLDRFHLLT